MKNQECAYCMQGEMLDAFGIYICDLDVSTFILFKEQSKRGRCIVAYSEHVGEIVDISKEKRDAFMADVTRAANAIHKVFVPDKLNYGAYGDTGNHLHIHLVPKYKTGDEWGGTFQMNPNRVYLEAQEYEKMIAALKKELNET